MALVLLSLAPASGFAARSKATARQTRAAYEESWKWYLHRKTQGAPRAELVKILTRMKQKYPGQDLRRVNRELARFQKPAVPASAAKPQAQTPAAAPQESRGRPPASGSRPAPGNAALDRRLRELKDPRETVRAKAAQDLGRAKAVAAVEPLVSVLADESTFVSMAAARALAEIGEPSLRPLLGALNHANPNVRIAACVALEDLQSDKAVPALEARTKDREERVRLAAAKALENIRRASDAPASRATP